jgi:hypothetical protein
MELIDKIWREVERMQDAAARGRHKMYMWAMYKFSFTEFLYDLSGPCHSANRLDAERLFWGKCRARDARAAVTGKPWGSN